MDKEFNGLINTVGRPSKPGKRKFGLNSSTQLSTPSKRGSPRTTSFSREEGSSLGKRKKFGSRVNSEWMRFSDTENESDEDSPLYQPLPVATAHPGRSSDLACSSRAALPKRPVSRRGRTLKVELQSVPTSTSKAWATASCLSPGKAAARKPVRVPIKPDSFSEVSSQRGRTGVGSSSSSRVLGGVGASAGGGSTGLSGASSGAAFPWGTPSGGVRRTSSRQRQLSEQKENWRQTTRKMMAQDKQRHSRGESWRQPPRQSPRLSARRRVRVCLLLPLSLPSACLAREQAPWPLPSPSFLMSPC